ncbi:MAG: penicillin-binding protein activator LpoB [Spirochaetaceae bacterium]|jgi:PBP1b-binding outer membrane lipoprotein LpoB|nr:penicillin-binding protein activator LpoB [Spirochaetaceae bacterium]
MQTHAKTLIAAGITALLCLGCAATPAGVTRVSVNEQIDLTGRWNDTDARTVCAALIGKCLESPRVSKFVSDYKAKNKGRAPAVIVGTFRNTSSEHIDTTIISRAMEVAIQNDGRLDFVAGGEELQEMRALREDQLSNASEATAAALGNETGADLVLTGEVKAIVETLGGEQVRSYFVSAAITDIETTVRLWTGDDDSIKKYIKRPKVKL